MRQLYEALDAGVGDNQVGWGNSRIERQLEELTEQIRVLQQQQEETKQTLDQQIKD